MNRQDAKNLKKRYLVWFYKTTKEALDKIERKFTQAGIDRFILGELKKSAGHNLAPFIAQFEDYIRKKEEDGLNLKFADKKPKPDYLFLELKLESIEKAIVKELGKEELKKIKFLYEAEMTGRILKSTEH